MTARICLDCRRTKATDAEWKAFLEHGSCSDPQCVWAEDRCFAPGNCGQHPDADFEQRVNAAKELRHGRPLEKVPHEHLDLTSSEALQLTHD